MTDLFLAAAEPIPVLAQRGWRFVERNGSLGWIGLVVYVVVWDVIALRAKNARWETLSSFFGRNLQRPGSRYALLGVWGLLTAHLFEQPRQLAHYDPLRRLAVALHR